MLGVGTACSTGLAGRPWGLPGGPATNISAPLALAATIGHSECCHAVRTLPTWRFTLTTIAILYSPDFVYFLAARSLTLGAWDQASQGAILDQWVDPTSPASSREQSFIPLPRGGAKRTSLTLEAWDQASQGAIDSRPVGRSNHLRLYHKNNHSFATG